jgi:hypothetical protein
MFKINICSENPETRKGVAPFLVSNKKTRGVFACI